MIIISITVTFMPNVIGDKLCSVKVDPENPNYKGYVLMNLAVAGASAWSCLIQLLRISIEVKKATKNGKAISWLAFLTTFVMTAQQFQNVAHKTPLCNDYFGSAYSILSVVRVDDFCAHDGIPDYNAGPVQG